MIAPWIIPGPHEQKDIILHKGWNLFSLPLMPYTHNPAQILAPILDKVEVVWGYDPWAPMPERWKVYTPDPEIPDTLTVMKDGYGYWIKMKEMATLRVYGFAVPFAPGFPPSYPLALGWNLIGFKSTEPLPALNYLASVAWWTSLFGYDPVKLRFFGVWWWVL